MLFTLKKLTSTKTTHDCRALETFDHKLRPNGYT